MDHKRKYNLRVYVVKTGTIFFIVSLLYVVLCKYVMPPITITQLTNSVAYNLQKNYVCSDSISPNVPLAVIASEDQEFLNHHGFDWVAIGGSLTKFFTNNKHKKRLGYGTSSISQQVAKNVFLWQGNGFSRYFRKGLEIYFTLLIERVWEKKRIMEVYLNVIEMGPGVFGISAAAQSNFGKSAINLTKREAAKIVACFPNPKKFTVHRLSKRVEWRYPKILFEMRQISDNEKIMAFVKQEWWAK